MPTDAHTALELAREADFWKLAVEFGEDVSPLERDCFSLSARCFNTVVWFLAPAPPRATWRLAEQRAGTAGMRDLGAVSVPQVIDTVPAAAESWVLELTREAVQGLAFLGEEDPELRRASLRLRSELEQGQAHRDRWRRRAQARYGDVLMYDFATDAQLRYEPVVQDGIAALLITDTGAGGELGRVLVAPSVTHPWRYSEPGRVNDYGERLCVQDAVALAGPGHGDWVREHSAYALGETLAALRDVGARALTGLDTGALGELGRLSEHARELADGLGPGLG